MHERLLDFSDPSAPALASPGVAASGVDASAVRRSLAFLSAGLPRRAASSLLQRGIHEPPRRLLNSFIDCTLLLPRIPFLLAP